MFAGLFGSNTPQYKGLPQQAAESRSGVVGLITGMFAPSEPTYVRPQQAVAAPAPAQSSAVPTAAVVEEDEPGGEPEAEARHITIIVRPGRGTTVEEVVQFLQDCLGPDQ
jgi:hypothetical protein